MEHLCDGKFTFSDIYNSMVGTHDHLPSCMACCISSISHLPLIYEPDYQFKNSRLRGHELDGRIVRNSEIRAYSNRYSFSSKSRSNNKIMIPPSLISSYEILSYCFGLHDKTKVFITVIQNNYH